MRIFFSVGEPSGDLHGANLIRSLRSECPDVECVGYGGPRMREAGCELHVDLTELAVMFIWGAIWNLRRFWRLYQQARTFFRTERPDAVVLIDYPGFNWWIAKAAKEHGIPVFYYGAPQLWAWASWRVKKMRRYVDHVLCKLPFEEDWYRKRGCNAHFVGHPYFDELRERKLDPTFMDSMAAELDGRPLVCILPGSRRLEVRNNLPWFLRAVEKIRRQYPTARFAIASFNDVQAEMARELCAELNVDADVHVGRTAELIEISYCCMACSGSVSLELLYHIKPAVVLYWVNRFVFTLFQMLLVKVRFVTLVNLLASDDRFASRPRPYDRNSEEDRQIPYPEYPTCEDKSDELAEHVLEWLTSESAYRDQVTRIRDLGEQLVHCGASQTASSYIVRTLGEGSAESSGRRVA